MLIPIIGNGALVLGKVCAPLPPVAPVGQPPAAQGVSPTPNASLTSPGSPTPGVGGDMPRVPPVAKMSNGAPNWAVYFASEVVAPHNGGRRRIR